MADRRHIPISEFRDLGFLQEANRLFFHPHGLALEVTTVTTDPATAPIYSLVLNAEQFAELRELVDAHTDEGSSLRDRLEGAQRYDVGDAWLSGVWDVRDDPEGVIFGDQPEDKAAKAERVAAQRARHRQARTGLFGSVSDIEPVDWVHDEGERAHG